MTNRRSRARHLLILMIGAFALLSLVIAAACGGDDDDSGGDNGGGEPTATTDAGDGDGGDGGGGDGGDDGGGNGDSSLTDLEAFADDYGSFTGKVTYTITDFSEDGNAGLNDVSTMSIFQKDGSSRFDISSPDGDISFITTPDAAYLCSSGPGGGDCLQYPADDQNAGAAVSAFANVFSTDSIGRSIDEIPNGVDVNVSNETIAGIDATCFSYSGDVDPDQAGDESSEFCFSDSGLMLRLAFEGADGSGSFEATAASSDVSDSDFDPPFPVTDLSDLGDLFQTP